MKLAKVALACALSTLPIAGAFPAHAGSGTRRVSVDLAGGDPDGGSYVSSLTADAGKVAFRGSASDLVPGDDNGVHDVFVTNPATGTTTRASIDAAGRDSNAGSFAPSISADGRFVAFHSYASDLVSHDGNDEVDVFVRDLVGGTTVRASVDTRGRDANGGSLYPSISADGRFVAFHSDASDLTLGDENGLRDVFVRDLVEGKTGRVSVDTGGADANGRSLHPSISADGRFVAFDSSATDLVAGDGNGLVDVFVRDSASGSTVSVSEDQTGGDSNGGSSSAWITPDGGFVAFVSSASDLVSGDTNGISDIFVRDALAGSTVRASVDAAGSDPNGVSGYPALSADGRLVSFHSHASDLVAGDTNGLLDVFVRDLVAGVTVRSSVDLGGGDPNGESGYPTISADGRSVAFSSYATDLIAEDGNLKADVFLRRLS